MTLYKLKGSNRSLLALGYHFRIYLSTYPEAASYDHKLSFKQVVYGLGEYHFGLTHGEPHHLAYLASSQYDIVETPEFKVYKIILTMNYGG